MATKWINTITCQWCGGEARAGIEKDGLGNTYRVICRSCGIAEQAGMGFPAGEKIALLLKQKEDPFAGWWDESPSQPSPEGA